MASAQLASAAKTLIPNTATVRSTGDEDLSMFEGHSLTYDPAERGFVIFSCETQVMGSLSPITIAPASGHVGRKKGKKVVWDLLHRGPAEVGVISSTRDSLTGTH